MDAHVDWSGVRDRVIAVCEAEDRAAGQQRVHPVFEPVLSGSEITEAEAQYGAALPDEYRSFLAEVGAGGPGPELYLTSLRQVQGRWAWIWQGSPCAIDLSGPFVETPDWAGQQVQTLRAAGYEPASRDDDMDYLDDYQQAFGRDAGEEAWHLERDRARSRSATAGAA